MPFLRRRGNLASETDMRRLAVPDKQQSQARPSAEIALPSPASAAEHYDTDDDAAASARSSRGNDHGGSRPPTPPIQEETSKHRRFSVLRFRNASDSQLSLRAKQQAEQPPPLPRRTFTCYELAPVRELLADSPS